MISRRYLGWMLAAALSLPHGGLLAAPEDCLSRGNNAEIAACANQYNPGSATPRARPASPTPSSPQLRSVPVQAGSQNELRTVTVAPGGNAPPAPEPEGLKFEVDRKVLTYTVILGAVGGILLILAGIGFWSWGASLKRSCPWCASKISRSVHACPRCFRAV